jgi:hypothetical protein
VHEHKLTAGVFGLMIGQSAQTMDKERGMAREPQVTVEDWFTGSSTGAWGKPRLAWPSYPRYDGAKCAVDARASTRSFTSPPITDEPRDLVALSIPGSDVQSF